MRIANKKSGSHISFDYTLLLWYPPPSHYLLFPSVGNVPLPTDVCVSVTMGTIIKDGRVAALTRTRSPNPFRRVERETATIGNVARFNWSIQERVITQ